jgi:serine/threonine-protein kinase
VTGPDAGAAPAGRRVQRIFLLWTAAAVAVYAVAFWVVPALRDDPPPIGSVAVLPFERIGAPDGNEYFGAGVTADVIARLTRLADLKVIGPASVMRYRSSSEPVAAIARTLGVATVLRATIRREDANVRVAATLVEARTGEDLHAGIYEGPVADLFDIERALVRDVADALHQPRPADEAGSASGPTTHLEAWELYSRAGVLSSLRSHEALRRALDDFRQAAALDSGFAPAWAGLAHVHVVLAADGLEPFAPQHTQARAAAERALRIDASLGEAHAALAWAHWYTWDRAAADSAFRRALELNPGSVTVHEWYGLFLTAWNRVNAGEARLARAVQLEPLSGAANAGLGMVRYYARRYDDAIAQLERAIALDSTHAPAWDYLARALDRAGRDTAARAARERLDALRDDAGTPAGAVLAAIGQAAAGEIDAAFRSLDAALDSGSAALAFLEVEPGFDPLRADPRFEALLRRVRLR